MPQKYTIVANYLLPDSEEGSCRSLPRHPRGQFDVPPVATRGITRNESDIPLYQPDDLAHIAVQIADSEQTLCFAKRMASDSKIEKTVLVATSNLTAILFAWKPGEQTEYHSHGKSLGLVLPLIGQLQEDLYEKGERISRNLKPGTASILEQGAIHRLWNCKLSPAISLHLYANAPGGLETVEEYQQDEDNELLLQDGTPVLSRIRAMD